MTAPIAGFTRPVSESGAPMAGENAATRTEVPGTATFHEALTGALREPETSRSAGKAGSATRAAHQHGAPVRVERHDGERSDGQRHASMPGEPRTESGLALHGQHHSVGDALDFSTTSGREGEWALDARSARGPARDGENAPEVSDTAPPAQAEETAPAVRDDAALAASFVETAIGAGAGDASTSIAAALSLAAARTEAAPPPSADPTVVRRSITALVPELRLRLERVMERMMSEFGYSVEIVETTRSQLRQDELFAQGRSAPGPVVTWTRNSNHTSGRAADVIIDGSYGNPEAYEALARVARDEGLRSLSPRDSGHIELAAGPARAERTTAAQHPSLSQVPAFPNTNGESGFVERGPATPMEHGLARVAHVARVAPIAHVSPVAPVAQVAPMAAVARVAGVADVARVAHVASVASVGRTGMASEGAWSGSLAPSTPIPPALSLLLDSGIDAASGGGTAIAAGALRRGASDDASGRRDSSARDGERERGEAILAALDGRDDGALARALPSHEGATRGVRGDGEGVGALARGDATERIARVLKMQEAAGERPLSSVLLRLDTPDGGEDRIRIDLRGTSVGASFDVSDPMAADNLRSHAHELRQALGRQGLEGDSMTVRTTQRSTEPASLTAAALGAERDAMRIGSTAAPDGGGSTAKDSRNQPGAEQWRDGASQQRSRQQRRDGKENR